MFAPPHSEPARLLTRGSAACNVAYPQRGEVQPHASLALGDEAMVGAGSLGDNKLLKRSAIALKDAGNGAEEPDRDKDRQRGGSDRRADIGPSESASAVHRDEYLVALGWHTLPLRRCVHDQFPFVGFAQDARAMSKWNTRRGGRESICDDSGESQYGCQSSCDEFPAMICIAASLCSRCERSGPGLRALVAGRRDDSVRHIFTKSARFVSIG